MGDNKDFNNEPVFYCTHCLSLRIKAVPNIDSLDYCDECGATDIAQTDIETWEKMYKEKFGFNYLNKY